MTTFTFAPPSPLRPQRARDGRLAPWVAAVGCLALTTPVHAATAGDGGPLLRTVEREGRLMTTVWRAPRSRGSASGAASEGA